MRGKSGVLSGLQAMAKALYVAKTHTVIAYTRRRVDPLRLKEHAALGTRFPWIRVERITAWRLRTFGTPEEKADLPILLGWKQIAEFIDTYEASARALAERPRDPLPVQPKLRRNPENNRMEVWAYVDALRDWIEANALPFELRGGPTTAEDVMPPSVIAARKGEAA